MRELDIVKVRKTPAWGFAIYRTAYGATTEAPWQTLLAAIRTKVRAEVMALRIPRGDPPAFSDAETQECEEFLSLFVLDVKDDQPALEGKSMDQVREMIRANDERPSWEDQNPGGTLTTLEGAFMYVDEEVLETARSADGDKSSPPWVKLVELGYKPEDHKGNMRMPRHYFGWMKLSTRAVYGLWEDLKARAVYNIAPKWDETQLAVWDGW